MKPARTWRSRAQPVIAAAVASGRAAGLEGKALARHVSAAYPFGPREMYPYRIWCDEVRRQLKGYRGPAPGSRRRKAGEPPPPGKLSGQGSLFGEGEADAQ